MHTLAGGNSQTEAVVVSQQDLSGGGVSGSGVGRVGGAVVVTGSGGGAGGARVERGGAWGSGGGGRSGRGWRRCA